MIRAARLLSLLGCALLHLEARAASPERPSLEALADEVAESLASANLEPPIGLWVEGGHKELTRGFRTLLARQLAERALPAIVLGAEGEAEALARGARARTLAVLSLELEAGRVRARGEARSLWVNFWSGASETRPAAPALALAHDVVADALSFALAARPSSGPIHLGAEVLTRLPRWPGALGALSGGESERPRIIVVDEDSVWLLDPEGTPRSRFELSTIPADTACREPFATLAIDPHQRQLEVFTCGRGRGVTLSLKQEVLTAIGERALPVLSAGDHRVEAPLAPGEGRLAGGPPLLSMTAAGGLRLDVFANDSARLASPRGHVTLEATGAAGTLADLDGDGAQEVIFASAALAPGREGLRVFRAADLLQAQPRLTLSSVRPHLEFPLEDAARVTLLTSADLDGDGSSELIAASWDEDGGATLWRISGVKR